MHPLKAYWMYDLSKETSTRFQAHSQRSESHPSRWGRDEAHENMPGRLPQPLGYGMEEAVFGGSNMAAVHSKAPLQM